MQSTKNSSSKFETPTKKIKLYEVEASSDQDQLQSSIKKNMEKLQKVKLSQEKEMTDT